MTERDQPTTPQTETSAIPAEVQVALMTNRHQLIDAFKARFLEGELHLPPRQILGILDVVRGLIADRADDKAQLEELELLLGEVQHSASALAAQIKELEATLRSRSPAREP